MLRNRFRPYNAISSVDLLAGDELEIFGFGEEEREEISHQLSDWTEKKDGESVCVCVCNRDIMEERKRK